MTLAAITYRNVQHWANAHTKRYTPDSVETDMMDYYNHDERERKRMHHSSGPVRIYRAGGGSGGGSGGDGGADGGHGGINEGADTTELDIIYY